MNTHESYVSLETAQLLKQAGFDWECIRYYQNKEETLYGPLVEQFKLVSTNFNVAPIYMDQYSVPTLPIAQRWLREVKKINISVDYDPSIPSEPYVMYIHKITDTPDNGYFDSDGYFKTYEEALEKGIEKGLKLVLEK